MKRKTSIRITVTAFVTSKEADAEKSASGVVEIGAGVPKDWTKIIGSLISQAITLGDAKLMTTRAVEKYLEAQTNQ